MKPIAWIAAVLLFEVVSTTGASAATPEESLLVLRDAETVQTFELSPTTRQINYEMRLAYPEQAIGEPQWQQLEATGWHRCRFADPAQEAANQDWVKVADASVTPSRTVHQRQTYWAKDDQLIAVKLRYYSAADGPAPDNTTQRVHLVFYSERAQAMAVYLKVDCAQ
jgi:hypothetical protein